MEKLPQPSAYSEAGVDIDAQERGLAVVKKLARATFTPGVLSEIGSFGGLFRPDLSGLAEPVLVASADGCMEWVRAASRTATASNGSASCNLCRNTICHHGLSARTADSYFPSEGEVGTENGELAVGLKMPKRHARCCGGSDLVFVAKMTPPISSILNGRRTFWPQFGVHFTRSLSAHVM
jgi:phosphoribosylaminoimidazole (AIR) synthetase